MTTDRDRAFALISTARERPEEQGIIAGVQTYLQHERLDWEIVPVPKGKTLGRQFLRRMSKHSDRPGVIIGDWRPEAPDFQADCFPWVEWVADPEELNGSAGVCFDVRSTARLAVNHLIAQGARTLAITYAPSNTDNRRPEELAQHLQAEAAKRNRTFMVLWEQRIENKAGRAHYFSQLADFCARMPKPCGFFCLSDESAEWLISDLLYLNIAVPDEAMVLGGSGSSGASCARIPLSSIRLPYHALGVASARQAHRLLSGGCVDEAVSAVSPLLLDARQSTAMPETSQHPILQRAEQVVESAQDTLPTVAELAQACDCSRQYLLKLMQRTMDCTPDAWLKERAMHRAVELLASTTLGLQEIAQRCGMSRSSSFSVAFKRYFGESPGKYRYQHCGVARDDGRRY